ncbi:MULTISPECIES: histidine triad nucleotide-binding protein [unclassified Salinibacterium]|uniref:histidine triad nucleotide-binding protein n=1 Tax=unclassified Salinibacterium TaxID=2632331 RepID=UPI0018CCA222|nr:MULTISPECIES: histidine triad nucleotide-binding protein [unclassified Salinibacterium]MBH0053988.1 histidine triad nucleotide-binding protein [Salinibacterium sp. SWN139]MBH0083270.1 histidine triad nucleotide-binding protein [Salinibacterium sp. SWN167]MBH0115689.1 histidine triad nucleotide-binding protein [Salinibacterium sp. NG253]
MSDSPSIFTKIIAREIPADIVFESDSVIAFRDIAPKAPVHLLIVPKTEEFANVTELAAGNPALLADIVAVAQKLADDYAGGQYRLIFNTGENAGQTVFHVHAHVLGGNLEEGTLGH